MGEEREMGGGERQTDRQRQTQRKSETETGKNKAREKDSREAEEKRQKRRPRTNTGQTKNRLYEVVAKMQREMMTNLHTQILSQLTCLSCPFCEDPSPLLP